MINEQEKICRLLKVKLKQNDCFIEGNLVNDALDNNDGIGKSSFFLTLKTNDEVTEQLSFCFWDIDMILYS